MSYANLACSLLSIFSILQGIDSLRLIDIHVPSIAFYGQSVQLNCTYELEYDQLYAIKWYRDDDEFYRYLPTIYPPEHFYRTKGLYVDMGRSSKGLVHLTRVDLQSDGLFRCEVSAESPSFQTVRKQKQMQVFYLPKEPPRIRIQQDEKPLKMGSFLNLTCESGYSRPPARLQLLINNHAVNVKQANLIQVVHEYTGPDEPIPAVNTSTSGSPDRPIHSFRLADHSPASSSLTERHFWRPSLYRSSLHMLFYLDSNDFGVSTWIEQRPTVLLRVKCVAFVSHLHTQNALRTLTVFPTELMTSTISPDLIAQHQPEESASNHSEPTLHTDRLPKVGGPFIFGAQRSYLPGQTVNVTCASRKSRFGSDLRWYINDHEAPYRFVRNYRRIELDDGIVTLIDLFFTLPESSAMSTVTPAIAVATSNASTSAGNHLTFQQSLLASPLRLRCTAILSRVVNMRSKELLLDADQSIFNSQNDSISSRSENISLNVFVLVTIFISHLIRRRQSA